MRWTTISVLAAIGVTACAAGASADDAQSKQQKQRADLRGAPPIGQECGFGPEVGFIEVSPFGNAGGFSSPFRFPVDQQFALTDIEWTATSIDASKPQQLLVSNLATFSPTQTPVLIVPASTISGNIAYGQVHLETGRVIHGVQNNMQGICASASGSLDSIEIQGFLEQAQ